MVQARSLLGSGATRMIRPGADQGAVATFVLALWRREKDARIQKEQIWDECFRARDSIFGGTWLELRNFRSKRYLPVSNQAVENVTSHLVQGVIPHDDWMQVEGRTPDDDASAKPMAELLKWQHFKTGFESETTKILRQAVTCGQAPWCMTWTQDINSVPDNAAHAQAMGEYMADLQSGALPPESPVPTAPQMAKTVYDGPALTSCSIYDYVEERQNRGSSYPARVIRSFVDKAHLLEWSKPSAFGHSIYENVKDISENQTQTEASDGIVRAQDSDRGFSDVPRDAVELLEFWGDLVLDGTLFKNHVAVVANRTTLIRFEPNPFAHGLPPWNMFVLKPRPNDNYGEGSLEPALDLQDAINVRFNQIIDANNISGNPDFLYVDDGVFDADNYISAPGIGHRVSDINKVQWRQIPSNSGIGMQELGFLLAQFNESTNAMKAFTTADYQKSATEVSAIAGATDSSFAQIIKHVERTFVMPALRMQIELNQQLMDQAVWVRVVEVTNPPPALDDFGQPKPVPLFEPMLTQATRLKINPADIQGEFDIYPVGAQWVANNQAALGALGQMMQTLGSIPPAAETIRWSEAARVMFRAARIPQSWNLVKSQMEVAYDRQQQQQMQLAREAQQAALNGGPEESGEPQGGPPRTRGLQSVAGTPRNLPPPANPGGQPSAGGPQTQ